MRAALARLVSGCGRGGPHAGEASAQVAARAPAGGVISGVDATHRQHGHYPWRADCEVCCGAALRSAQHRRQLPHAGVLAVDLASLGMSGPHVLVGATQLPGWQYAEPVRSKSAADLRAPLLHMVQDAKTRGVVSAVHADKETGLRAPETDLLGVGVALWGAKGGDPQANGLAEATVGQLARMAREVLH